MAFAEAWEAKNRHAGDQPFDLEGALETANKNAQERMAQGVTREGIAGLDGGAKPGWKADAGAGGKKTGFFKDGGTVSVGKGDDKQTWKLDPETGEWQRQVKTASGELAWRYVDPSEVREFEGQVFSELAEKDITETLQGEALDRRLARMSNEQLEELANLKMAKKVLEEERKRRRVSDNQGGFLAKGFVPNFARGSGAGGKFRGFIPNYSSQLEEAKDREITALMARGYSRSEAAGSVYVQEHPAISSNNLRIKDIAAKGYVPNFGVGVFNRIDEPLGAGQGISRARSEGANINTYGSRRGGNVPNFTNNAPMGYVPNFEAATQQIDAAAASFGEEISKAAENLAGSIANQSQKDDIEQVINMGVNTSQTANINVNIDGTVKAIPNAIAQAVIDWSKGKMIRGGGYLPPNRTS